MKTKDFFLTCGSAIRTKLSAWPAKRWGLLLTIGVGLLVGFILVKKAFPTVETTFLGEEIGMNGLRYKDHQQIYNPKTDQVLVDSINWLHINYSDTIGILAKNGKRAYINLNTGALITPLEYDKAWIFAYDRGVMVKSDSVYVFRRDGSVVNKKGIYCSRSYEMVYAQQHLVVCSTNSKEGVLDTAANWVLQPEYEKIEINYHHNLLNTKLGEQCVVYDKDLNIILQGNYKVVEVDWSEGLIATEHNGIQHLFSYKGEMLYEVIFRSIKELTYNTERRDADNNLIYENTDCFVYEDYNGKCGLMDHHYKVLTPPMFSNIEAQTHHVFFASFGEYGDRFGTLIDNHGKPIH